MVWMYAGFCLLVILLLALDLGVFHRKAHVVGVREALGLVRVLDRARAAFTGFIYFGYEHHWLGLGLTPDMMTAAPRTVDGVGAVYNDGSSARGQVHHRLPRREVARRRQHLRHRHDLRLLRGAADLPAPGAVLGHPGRAADARGDDRRSARALIQRVPLDHLRLRRVPDPHRHQDAASSKADETDPNRNVVVRLTRRIFPVTERFHGEHFFVRAGTAASHEAATPGAAELHDRVVDAAPAGRPAGHAAVPGPGDGRVHRPDLRRRLDPGHLRHHRRPVPGLHQQRVRDPRACAASTSRWPA